MSVYFWILVASMTGPLLMSFDKKVHFFRYWKFLFPAILIVAVVFIAWDEYFTQLGVWGFNPEFLQGIYIGHLPLEECLFFVFIPYACMFIHEVLKAYYPNIRLKNFPHFFAFAITVMGFIFGISSIHNVYTASACIATALLTIGFYFVFRVKWYAAFTLTFLVSMIPFLLVNGILTGAITASPIVWYNENQILGFRIYTIPIEDVFYNYCMLLLVMAIYEGLKNRKNLKN